MRINAEKAGKQKKGKKKKKQKRNKEAQAKTQINRSALLRLCDFKRY